MLGVLDRHNSGAAAQVITLRQARSESRDRSLTKCRNVVFRVEKVARGMALLLS